MSILTTIRTVEPDNLMLRMSLSADELFSTIKAETSRYAQELRDKNNVADPDRYVWSEDERADFNRRLPNVISDAITAMQPWAPNLYRGVIWDDSTSTFSIVWGPIPKVPDMQIGVALSDYITNNLLLWWWDHRIVAPLIQLFSEKTDIARDVLRSALYTRNPLKVKFHFY